MKLEQFNTSSLESMYSNTFHVTVKGHIRFETKSFFGRSLLNRKPPKLDTPEKLLHLGCGTRLLEDWVNADFFVTRFWRLPKSFWMVDLRYPLLCDSDYWNGIFTEHTLEHLYPLQVRNLLGELLRTLMPKSWLRIVVPDLRKYVDFYLGKSPPQAGFQKWTTGAEAIRSVSQNWGHLSLWDFELLSGVLSDIGFTNIRQMDFLQASDQRLLKDQEYRRWESMYIEAQKP